jgi:alanine dehydrogenase
MIVGLPKEIKNNEYRVGLVPAGVKALVDGGHTVLVSARRAKAAASSTPNTSAQAARSSTRPTRSGPRPT